MEVAELKRELGEFIGVIPACQKIAFYQSGSKKRPSKPILFRKIMDGSYPCDLSRKVRFLWADESVLILTLLDE